MKCGICGKDTWLGFRGETRKIYDARDLARHKKANHPKEWVAARDARRTKAETTKQAKVTEEQRVRDARLAASKPVVVRYRDWETPVSYPSSNVARHQVSSLTDQPHGYVRFPDAEAYKGYLSAMAELAGWEAEARAYLIVAWTKGTPVTLEHLDELDRAAVAKEVDHAN